MTILFPSLRVSRVHCIAGFLLFLLVIGKPPVHAQVYESLEDTTVYFKARVLDSLTRKPVAFAHIINISRRTATISDTLGYFYIRTSPGEQLQLTAIGFTTGKLTIGYSLLRSPIIHDIMLQPIIYSIEAVRVNPLGSYEQFKQHFATVNLPESKYQIHPSVMTEIEEGTDTLDMLIAPAISPITALYNLLSKEGKSKRKLRKLLRQEEFERQIDFKYSPDIVSHITGYTGFDLYEFMAFCNFKKEFLLNATYYEITQAVLDKQQKFQADPEK
jgi:hypothetical protein